MATSYSFSWIDSDLRGAQLSEAAPSFTACSIPATKIVFVSLVALMFFYGSLPKKTRSAVIPLALLCQDRVFRFGRFLQILVLMLVILCRLPSL